MSVWPLRPDRGRRRVRRDAVADSGEYRPPPDGGVSTLGICASAEGHREIAAVDVAHSGVEPVRSLGRTSVEVPRNVPDDHVDRVAPDAPPSSAPIHPRSRAVRAQQVHPDVRGAYDAKQADSVA